VIDTPGIREFQPFRVSPGSLWKFYPEMLEGGEACRFRDCLHIRESGCRILAALEEGRIDAGRYERYQKILASLQKEERC
ncbi:MAG: ribosome small subunit-dependent GTPase A, partial [Planctomycetota bacterium]